MLSVAGPEAGFVAGAADKDRAIDVAKTVLQSAWNTLTTVGKYAAAT